MRWCISPRVDALQQLASLFPPTLTHESQLLVNDDQSNDEIAPIRYSDCGSTEYDALLGFVIDCQRSIRVRGVKSYISEGIREDSELGVTSFWAKCISTAE